MTKSTSENQSDIKFDNIPKYITKQPEFSCPVSIYILWHHGLEYKTCPIVSEQRDMPSCSNCKLRGDNKIKIRNKEKKNKQPRKSSQSNNVKVPTISKTYTSE